MRTSALQIHTFAQTLLLFRLATTVENAYYQCVPPERAARKEKSIPVMVQYIQKLIYNDVNRHTVKDVLKQLRKLPWEEYEVRIRYPDLCQYSVSSTSCAIFLLHTD